MTDYLEGALGDRERRRFERHLALCPPCQRVLDQLRATSATLAALAPDAIEPDLRQRLVALYRSYRDDPDA